MKYVFFLLFLFPFALSAQEYNADVHKVVDAPNTTKEQLYNNAMEWIAKEFRNANSVIQLADKEQCKIILKGGIPYNAPAFVPGTAYSGSFTFTMTIQFKDNKYKYDIEDVAHEAYQSINSIGLIDIGKHQKKIRETAVKEIDLFANSFELGMLQKNTESKDNW